MDGTVRAPSASPARATNRGVTVAALLLAMFLAAMEMTVVTTVMPTVVNELGGAEHYAWVFSAYMLTSTLSVPIYGKLADLYGRKPVILTAISLFLLGSIACGQARTMHQLIVFRAVQGLGAGGVQPIAVTVVGDIFDIEERGKMQAVFGAVWAVAGLVGPLLGGALVTLASWRWVFYLNLPVGFFAMVMLTSGLAEVLEKKAHKLDVLGALLLSLSVVTLLLGTDGVFPVLLLPASAATGALFLFAERRAAEPILPLGLFAEPLLGVASILFGLSGGALFGILSFVPLYAQQVAGATPTAAGTTVATMAVSWPVASAIAGRLIPRLGFRHLVRYGTLVVAVSAAGTAYLLFRGGSVPMLATASALFGIGMGFSNSSCLIAVQTGVGFSQRGVATASTVFFRSIGGTISVGVMGVVLAHGLRAGAGSVRSGLAGVGFVIASLSIVAAVVAFFFPADKSRAELVA